MFITAIIPLRFHPKRNYFNGLPNFGNIDNSINSLLQQDIVKEILIVNHTPSYVSNLDPQIEHIKNRFIDSKVKIIDVSNSGDYYFNRSWLLNIGIKNSSNEILISYDVDCIIQPDFSEVMSHNINSLYTNILQIQNFGYNESNIDWKDFEYPRDYEKMKKKLSFRPGDGVLIYKKDLILQIKGYNEKFQIWGMEDAELLERFREIKIKLLLGRFNCLHQPHSFVTSLLTDEELKYNEIKYNFLDNENETNKNGWGEIDSPRI